MLTGLATKAAVAAALLAAGVTGGAYVMHKLESPALVSITEKAAPAVTQADGSLVLERQATAAPGTVKPAAIIPKGATLVRQVQITAKPKVAGDAAKVELDVVKMNDNTQRVIAYSDNAVVGGVDIPVEPLLVPAPSKKWAAGAYMDPLHRNTYGVFVDRDLGRIRLGAELGHSVRGGVETRIKIGLTF